jgi:hypothetical protein
VIDGRHACHSDLVPDPDEARAVQAEVGLKA